MLNKTKKSGAPEGERRFLPAEWPGYMPLQTRYNSAA
jgi:hypothetical protein